MQNLIRTAGAFFACLVFSISGFSQERINLSAGIGITEGANIGMRYQLKQSQLGVTIGTFPYRYNESTGVNLNYKLLGASYYHHFSGRSKFTNRKPLYFKTSVSYCAAKEGDATYKKAAIGLSLGRDLNLSRRTGFNISAGGYIMPFSQTERQGEVFQDGTGLTPYASIDVSFFIRLL
jgi:hypothetical protein